ncbi:protein tweety homolog 1 isoform X3 [Carlito syrichta]|uniref:Protein tweety homolog n=1 Tax=Carlito syrichta TaxID=1868482 RepID=A0A1U7UIH5_CARSF|nr:protein tweety homolog 1 isoform X3 [Carlito syrichta]
MGAPPGYRPSAWVHLLHQLPRADFQLRPVPSGFAPREQEYQQALLLLAALAGLGLGLSLIVIAVYLIRFCCCRAPELPGSKSPSPGGGCVTWSCIAALLVGCAGIGIGFYGNSETSDGVSQLSSALLHANHTLSAIDHLVLETVERLGEAVRTELTTLEEVLEQRTELVAAARGARRQAEAVAQQLQGLAFWQGVPLSPLQVAEDVSFVEEYRWLAYVLLLLLELLVCLFTLLGLAKQSKWLVIVMTVMSLLVLILSWGSMGLEAAAAVALSDFCSNPDTYILNLTQEETGLSSEADCVPESSGQHSLPAAGPRAGSCPSVPLSAEASVVLGGDAECDRRKLPPVGGTAALPWPAQGLWCGPAGPVRRRPGRPALPAALLPAVRGGPGHRPVQPAPRLGPLPAQESKRFVQWQSSI